MVNVVASSMAEMPRSQYLSLAFQTTAVTPSRVDTVTPVTSWIWVVVVLVEVSVAVLDQV